MPGGELLLVHGGGAVRGVHVEVRKKHVGQADIEARDPVGAFAVHGQHDGRGHGGEGSVGVVALLLGAELVGALGMDSEGQRREQEGWEYADHGSL